MADEISRKYLTGQVTVEWATCWAKQFDYWRCYLLSDKTVRQKLKLHLPCKYCQIKKCNFKP